MQCNVIVLKAEEITLTIGQAFDLAYRRFLETSGQDLDSKKQCIVLQKKVCCFLHERFKMFLKCNARRELVHILIPTIKSAAHLNTQILKWALHVLKKRAKLAAQVCCCKMDVQVYIWIVRHVLPANVHLWKWQHKCIFE